MADIQSAAALASVYPGFIKEITDKAVSEAVAAVQNDSKRTAEVDELKASVAAKDKEIEELNAKHAGELKGVKDEQAALKKQLDDLTASTTKNEKEALGERLIQSSKLGPIYTDKLAGKNKDFADKAVSDDFVARVKCSADEAAMQALIDERVGLLNLGKSGVNPGSTLDTDESGEKGDAGVEERRGAFSTIFGQQPESNGDELKELAKSVKAQGEKLDALIAKG